MTAEELVGRLTRVKATGARAWRCECPNHGGHSLSVKELPDGRLLLKCWAGCDTQAVLDAMGLRFADLFPQPLGNLPPVRSPWNARDVLALAMREATTVAIVAADLLEHRDVSEADWQRLATAHGRLSTLVSEVLA